MEHPKFTQEQASFLADKIINKLVMPMYMIEEGIKTGVVRVKFLQPSLDQLNTIVHLIREIGG